MDLLIGSGGMGEVYRATSDEGRPVAIKVLRSELAEQRVFRERFLQEAELTEKLDHPGIVKVEEHGSLPDGSLYMIMEFLEGDNLSEELKTGERIAWPRALWITQKVLEALAVVHKAGMIHRDIKPENIFMIRGFQGRTIKLFDFGLAKSSEETESRRDLTQPGFAIGTPTYLAPERVVGRGADPRSDLYSLSVLLYEMLTGTTPFVSNNLEEMLAQHVQKQPPPFSQVAPDTLIPPTVEMLVMRGLSKDPEQRFQDASEYARAIEGVLAEDNDRTTAIAGKGTPKWWRALQDRVFDPSANLVRRYPVPVLATATTVLVALIVVIIAGSASDGAGANEPANKGSPILAAAPATSGDELVASVNQILSSWRERGFEPEGFGADTTYDLGSGSCRAGAVRGLEISLCRFESEQGAMAAERAAIDSLDAPTVVAVAARSNLLLVADRSGADPEGRTIQELASLFQGQSK